MSSMNAAGTSQTSEADTLQRYDLLLKSDTSVSSYFAKLCAIPDGQDQGKRRQLGEKVERNLSKKRNA